MKEIAASNTSHQSRLTPHFSSNPFGEMSGEGFSSVEKSVIVVFSVLALVFGTLYLSHFSFRKTFLGSEELSGAKQVASISQKIGKVRKKPVKVSEFSDVKILEPLFNEDTIVTGPASSTVIQLSQGGTIDLGPDTMVKLSFSTQSMFGLEIARVPKIEVVTGKVAATNLKTKVVMKSKTEEFIAVAQEKPREIKAVLSELMPQKIVLPKLDIPIYRPVPRSGAATRSNIQPPAITALAPVVTPTKAVPPPPLVIPKITIDEPLNGAELTAQIVNEEVLLQIPLRVSVEPRVELVEVELTNPKKEVLKEDLLFDAVGKGSIVLNVSMPGAWSAIVRDPAGKFSATRSFSVSRALYGLPLKDFTVSGSTTGSSVYSSESPKEFSGKFTWAPLDEVDHYLLQILNENGKSVFSKKTKEESFEVTDISSFASKLGYGKLTYKVSAILKSGFIANSLSKPIQYQFLPPLPTSPANGAEFSLQSLKADKGRILFSWQKTNFTEEYEVELSRDQTFEAIYVNKRLKENFLIMKFSTPGNFWWRVRSFTKGKPGLVSNAFTVSISQ